jgi:hypothetical protein
MRRLLPPLVAVLALSALVGCSGDSSSSDGTDGSTDSSAAAATTGTAQPITWEKVAAPEDCECSDGSEFHWWQHEGDATRVLFVLEGGGACFSAETCGDTADATAKPNLAADLPDGPGFVRRDGTPVPASQGLVDVANPDNPLAGYSVVYVPYCTGDLHLGSNTQDYGDGVVVEHDGRTNATAALEGMAASFPDAEEVVVLGFSAGSAGAPLYGGLAHDLLPDAEITVIADASGAYPGDPVITSAIGGLWGIFADLPAWPESVGEPQTDWSLPGLFVQTGRHVPGVTLATIDTANDEVQRRFTDLIGFAGTPLPELIDRNATFIESEGVPVSSWVGPGDLHVSTASDDDLYGTEVEGTVLVDWLRDLLAGEDVADVRCTDCG